jgi:hypothetical protein
MLRSHFVNGAAVLLALVFAFAALNKLAPAGVGWLFAGLALVVAGLMLAAAAVLAWRTVQRRRR